MADTPLKVMGLSGSIGRQSKNGMLVDLALRKAQENGAEVHFWDLEENLCLSWVKKAAGPIRL